MMYSRAGGYLCSALAAGLWLAPAVSSHHMPPTPIPFPPSASSSMRWKSQLECLSCPYIGTSASDDGQPYYVDSTIVLQYEASLENGLSINGQPLFLPTSNASVPIHLTAAPYRYSDGAPSQPLELGAFVLVGYDPVASSPGDDFLFFQFTITSLDSTPVKVDTVEMHFLKSKEQIYFLDMSIIEFKATHAPHSCGDKSRWSMCRIRDLLVFNFKQMLAAARHHGSRLGFSRAGGHAAAGGCSGRKNEGQFDSISYVPHGHGGNGNGNGRGNGHGHDGHQPHPYHKHHHKHGHMHRFGKFMHQIMRYFFIPATLGIIGGLMASALGMLLIQFAILLGRAIFFFRTPTQPEEQPISPVQVLIVEDAKVPLMMEENEELPQYHDHPPQYKDTETPSTEEKN